MATISTNKLLSEFKKYIGKSRENAKTALWLVHDELKQAVGKKKVAIIGSASSTKDQAPYDDPTFDIWALAWRSDVPRVTKYFDIHNIDEERKSIPKDYFEFLCNQNAPVYLQRKLCCIPNSLEYPLDEVCEFLGQKLDPYSTERYFTSSIAYMIALAIYEMYDEIHVYGVDLIEDSEFAYQKPAAEYLLGVARGLGIGVFIPDKSALLKASHLYGYERTPDVGVLDMKLLEKRFKDYSKQQEKALAQAQALDGAKQEAEALLNLVKQYVRGSRVHKNDELWHTKFEKRSK